MNTKLLLKPVTGLVLIIAWLGISAYAREEVSTPNSSAMLHYRNGWFKHLGNPTGKPDWQKKAAEKAVIEFRKAIEIEPGNALFLESLAFAFKKLGQSEKAEEQYKEATKLTPQESFPHYALGKLYARDKSAQDKAINELRIAIQLNPNETLCHYYLAHLLYMKAAEYRGRKQFSTTVEKLARQALDEIQTGNKKAQFTQYLDPYPRDFRSKEDYIRLIALWSREALPELEMKRALARESIGLGRLYEKEANEEGVLEVYQAILIMGKKFGQQKPLAIINVNLGVFVDLMALNALEEYYSGRGMKDELQWIQKTKDKLGKIQKLCRKQASELMRRATPSWTEEENELKQKRGDELLFLEAPFVRKMLQIWPTIALPPKHR